MAGIGDSVGPEKKRNRLRTAAWFIPGSGLIYGARSAVRSAGLGVPLLAGARHLVAGVSQGTAVAPARTFEDELSSKGVDERLLPVVHNHLVLQVYCCFVVALMAACALVVHLLQAKLSAVMALSVLVAAIAQGVKCSTQAYMIRHRNLQGRAAWRSSSDEWFPSRVETSPMHSSDPLCEPSAVRRIAVRCRARFWLALLFACGYLGGTFALGDGWAGTSVLLALASGASVALCAADSFEVYKRRTLRYADLVSWVATPSAWLPRIEA